MARGTIKHFWTLVIGEELILEAKDRNSMAKHTVAVMNEGFIVRHIHILCTRAMGNAPVHIKVKDITPSTGTWRLLALRLNVTQHLNKAGIYSREASI